MGTETIKRVDIKVASKTSNLSVISQKPKFKYKFEEKDTPILMPKSHADKILKNNYFYIFDELLVNPKIPSQIKPKQGKSWKSELDDIKGIGQKTAEDIISIYPNKEDLLKSILNNKKLPLRDDISRLLKEVFIP